MTKRSIAMQMLIELQLKFSIQRDNALEMAKWSVENTINTMKSMEQPNKELIEYWSHLRKEFELL